MFAIIFLVNVIIAMYIGFCVEKTEATWTGQFKIKMISLIQKLINCKLFINDII
jgi:hypothetical protein